MKRRTTALALLSLAALSPLAFAQPATKKSSEKPAPSASASASAAPPLKGTAIIRIAAQVATDIGAVPSDTLVAISPLATDMPAPKAEALANIVAAQIAGRLGAHAHPQPVALSVARAASGRAASLVFVQLELTKGTLKATADLYPVVSNGWERLRNPVPGPRAHSFTEAPIDAEVRTYLQPIALEQAAIHKVKHEEGDIIAAGCGDLDADGGLEIVLASRARIAVTKIRAGKLEVTATAPWKELAYLSPVPVREPLGTMIVRPNELLVGMTDRFSIGLDATLTPRRTLSGPPIPGVDACVLPSPEWNAFEGAGVACPLPPKGAKPAELFPLPFTRFDAVAGLELGNAQYLAAREPSGKTKLRKIEGAGKPIEQSIEQTGAQLAMADLDLDGTPEVAFSADFAESDALMIWSWKPGGPAGGLQQRVRVTTKEAVRAIAACPPEEKGLPAIVAVVGPEVWLVR